MKFEFAPNLGYNVIYYIDRSSSSDELLPTKFVLDTKKTCWEMSFCHELGHALSSKIIKSRKDSFKEELIAWRLGKSFCKPKYWQEKEAMRMLMTYKDDASAKINVDKLKIISLNTNKYLIKLLKSKKT